VCLSFVWRQSAGTLTRPHAAPALSSVPGPARTAATAARLPAAPPPPPPGVARDTAAARTWLSAERGPSAHGRAAIIVARFRAPGAQTAMRRTFSYIRTLSAAAAAWPGRSRRSAASGRRRTMVVREWGALVRQVGRGCAGREQTCLCSPSFWPGRASHVGFVLLNFAH